MNVQLSPDSMQFVEGLVASGQFESAEAAVAAGVQLLKSQQQLRAEIQKELMSSTRGKESLEMSCSRNCENAPRRRWSQPSNASVDNCTVRAAGFV